MSETPARTFTEVARRAQLISAAITTVTEIGYHRASLSEIAGRAGVAKSAIVYYFSSRDGLLLSVVDEVFAHLDAAVSAAVDRSAKAGEQLRSYARAYLDYAAEHRAEVAAGIEIVVAHRTDDGTPLYLAAGEDDTRLLRAILEQGMREGAFRRMPVSVAVAFIEALLDAPVSELQRDLTAELDTYIDETVGAVLRAVAA